MDSLLELAIVKSLSIGGGCVIEWGGGGTIHYGRKNQHSKLRGMFEMKIISNKYTVI